MYNIFSEDYWKLHWQAGTSGGMNSRKNKEAIYKDADSVGAVAAWSLLCRNGKKTEYITLNFANECQIYESIFE